MNKRPLNISIFYCTNSLDIVALRRSLGETENYRFKTISLPCSGKIELIYLLKTFETGADGAVLITCKKGECKHLEGNLRAHKRAQAVDTLLAETGKGGGRMLVTQMNPELGVEQIAGQIETLCSNIRNMGLDNRFGHV